MSSLSKVAVVDIGTTFFSPLLPNFTFFSRIHSRFGAATPLPRKIDRVAQRSDDAPFGRAVRVRHEIRMHRLFGRGRAPYLGESHEEELRRGEIYAGKERFRRRRIRELFAPAAKGAKGGLETSIIGDILTEVSFALDVFAAFDGVIGVLIDEALGVFLKTD